MKKTKRLFFIIAIILIAIIFYSVFKFNKNPLSVIYISQYVLIIYLFILLDKTKLSLLVLIYPVFKYFWYQFYAEDWFDTGDVIVYMGLLADTLKQTGLSIDAILATGDQYSRFYFLTIINIFIPMQVYGIDFRSSNSLILLYFNDLIFLILTVITTISFKGFISKRHLGYFVIFLLFSPTILSLTGINDRHLFTLFALLLFVRGYELFGTKKKINFYLILSIFMLFLNKKELILAVLIYVFILNRKFSKKPVITIISSILLFSSLYLFKDNILIYYNNYGTSDSIISVFGILIIPLKYIYAILSPFPWYKFQSHLTVSFGSLFLLLAWFLNSVTGLAITLSLIKYYKSIKLNKFYFKYFILFGLVMSTTIVLGNIGHSGYLSIYYILLIPVFFIIGKKKSVYMFFQSFIFIILINFVAFIAGF